MTTNIQQLISDSKKLSNRLKDDEAMSDDILSQAKNAQKQFPHLQQFAAEVDIQNEAASQRSQSVLIAGLQRENQHFRELQAENRELRDALDDYHNALELIMSKYRQQVSKLMAGSKSEIPDFCDSAYSEVVLSQCNQIRDMQEVMRRAADMGEEEYIHQKEVISQLTTENKGLREMFNIFKKNGYLQPEPELPPIAPKAEVTTEITVKQEENTED